MTVGKRVRKAAGITAKGLDQIVKRNLTPKQLISVLKRSVFSNEIGLRMAIAEDLIAMGHFRFLLNMAKRAKRKDFSDQAFRHKYKFGELPLKEAWVTKAVIARLKKGLAKGPVSKFRGFEVYEMEGLPVSAIFYWGKIVIDKNYPEKLKPVAYAHEVGEIFSHQIGLAMELTEVKRRKLEREYIENIKKDPFLSRNVNFLRQRTQVIDEHLPKMHGLKEQLMEILKAIPGLESGP